jgi:hypothetical protein
VEANSTGGQGSCRAVAPSDDDQPTCLQVHNVYTNETSSQARL